MDNKSLIDRTDKLISEINELKARNSEIITNNNTLFCQLHKKDSELLQAKAIINKLLKHNENLKTEVSILNKKYVDKVRSLENQIRKNDVFREVYKGSSKTRREDLANKSMEQVRKSNAFLLQFIIKMAKKFDFDDEVCLQLCQIEDEEIIDKFMGSIRNNNSDSNDNNNININNDNVGTDNNVTDNNNKIIKDISVTNIECSLPKKEQNILLKTLEEFENELLD